MIIEVSLAIIALAFVLLAIYIIVAIKNLCSTLHQLNEIMIEVKPQISDISAETKILLEQVNSFTMEVSKDIKPIMEAAHTIGEVAKLKASSLKQEAEYSFYKTPSSPFIQGGKESNTQTMGDVLELVGKSIHLWQKLKKRR